MPECLVNPQLSPVLVN